MAADAENVAQWKTYHQRQDLFEEISFSFICLYNRGKLKEEGSEVFSPLRRLVNYFFHIMC